jgi:putative peptidoglycan lipid II flippase
MVKKILSFVGKEISGLHEAAYLLALSSVASLIFAIVRDRLLAHMLGAGVELDVYYAAFRVPDFIYVAIASLVSTSILVPLLIESKQKGEVELKASIQSLFSAFSILILGVCAVAFVFMHPIQQVLFPNLFAEGMGDRLVLVSRILLLSPVLLGFSSFFASITQIQNRFLVYAVSSPLYNIGIILGIVFLLPSLGIAGIAIGVLFGSLMLSLTQIPLVVRDGLFPKFKLICDWSHIKKVACLSVPRTITMSSQQLTNLALVSFASFLGAGSISIFNLSQNLQSVPLSIIGVSYSSAIFPMLATLMAEGKKDVFVGKMISAAQHVIFWSVPLSVLFIVLRAQIVRTVLGSGEFSWSDTRLTAAALALFVISSIGQSLILLFVRSFYAEGKTAKPLTINVVSMFATIALGFGLIKLFHTFPTFKYFTEALLRVSGSEDSSVLMLPLAFSIGIFINLYLHWRSFTKDFSGFTGPVLKTAFHSFGASIIGGFVAYKSLQLFVNAFDLSTVFGIFMQGFCAGMMGIVVIITVLALLKSKELQDVWRVLHEKVWKVDRASLDKLPSE